MGLMVKYGVKDYINRMNKEQKIGLTCKSNNSVYFGSSSVRLESTMLPCVVIDQFSDIGMPTGKNSLNMLAIKLFFEQKGDLEKYDIMFEKLKRLFVKNTQIEYEYDSQTFQNVVEYSGGTDFYDGQTSLINGKSFKYIQFVVVSPQVNY